MKRLTDRLAHDRTVICAWSGIPGALYLSALATCQFDAITLDMQHGMLTESSVIEGLAALAPTGKPAIVRIPVDRFDFASKALDAGAHAIIAPMINTAADAKAFAKACKYVPLGNRSFGAMQAVRHFGTDMETYITQANNQTLALAMIETREAVENVEAILDVDGIDGVFVGPADLSISVRQDPLPDVYGPATIESVTAIAKAALERGKLAGAFCMDVEALELVHRLGYRFASLGLDETYLQLGANTELAKVSFR